MVLCLFILVMYVSLGFLWFPIYILKQSQQSQGYLLIRHSYVC